MTTATRPSPVAASRTTTARVHPVATTALNPSVNSELPLKYRASPNVTGPPVWIAWIPWTNAGLHSTSAYPITARAAHTASSTKKKNGAAPARIRSRPAVVLARTPTHRHGRHIGRNRSRASRVLPRAARGITSVLKTSSRVKSRMTKPTGSASQRMPEPTVDAHEPPEDRAVRPMGNRTLRRRKSADTAVVRKNPGSIMVWRPDRPEGAALEETLEERYASTPEGTCHRRRSRRPRRRLRNDGGRCIHAGIRRSGDERLSSGLGLRRRVRERLHARDRAAVHGPDARRVHRLSRATERAHGGRRPAQHRPAPRQLERLLPRLRRGDLGGRRRPHLARVLPLGRRRLQLDELAGPRISARHLSVQVPFASSDGQLR